MNKLATTIVLGVLMTSIQACGGADNPPAAQPAGGTTDVAPSEPTPVAADEPANADRPAGDVKPAADPRELDSSFDDAFVTLAMDTFEGLVVLVETTKNDCAAMAAGIEAYMAKYGHIKRKVDAVEADPEQNKRWDALTKADSDKLNKRMLAALGEQCLNDAELLRVIEAM